MYTEKSSIGEIYKNAVGKDLLNRFMHTKGKNKSWVYNPLISSLPLSTFSKLLGKNTNGAISALLAVLNNHQQTAQQPVKSDISQKWWKEAVVYQIYPRSFQDSNDDGIGDLKGIKQRIPYLKSLGVNAVWLSPIYDSPNDDMGYDIRNYKKIMKEFGNMQDFNSLLSELHKNDIRLIMDLVVNHTSDEHAWFKKALENPEAPEKDYYIWAKGKNGKEPNNWTSFFSTPAWNYYPENDEWALHLFSKKQMDLNWNNADLRHEVYEMINWWMDKGVDGFRMDVINIISKTSLEDGNEQLKEIAGHIGMEHYFYGPKLHEYIKEMRTEAFENRDAFLVGETLALGMEMAKTITCEENNELDVVFTFDHLDNPGKSRREEYQYDLRYLKPYYLEWQQNFGTNCWQSLFFDNHDNPRMVSKINPNPAWRMVISKLLAVLQLTLRGTPFIYQGQEIGMTNSKFTSVQEFKDVETINYYNDLLKTKTPAEAFEIVSFGTRDHARTPMQWASSENAGFTKGTPWLKINSNFPAINAENEQENPDSVFNFFKDLIETRKNSKALIYGDFTAVFKKDKNTFCYFRIAANEKYYIEMNLTNLDQKRPGPITPSHRLVMGNYGGTANVLRPYEANIYSL